MVKITLPLSLAALAVVAGCVSKEPVTPAPAPVVVAPAPVVTTPPPPATVVVPPASASTAPIVVPTPTAIRAGFGRVESITPTGTSAATGGTVKPQRRIGIKMDDGTVQYVDTAAEGLAVGTRVELTSDGHIRFPL